MAKMKQCTKCSIRKPVQFFGKQAASTLDGLKPHCRACIAVYNREYKTKNEGAYGITVKSNNEVRP